MDHVAPAPPEHETDRTKRLLAPDLHQTPEELRHTRARDLTAELLASTERPLSLHNPVLRRVYCFPPHF